MKSVYISLIDGEYDERRMGDLLNLMSSQGIVKCNGISYKLARICLNGQVRTAFMNDAGNGYWQEFDVSLIDFLQIFENQEVEYIG